MPSSTDCIQRQNKLEEFGVKYALQKREASASNEIQSLYVCVNGHPVLSSCTVYDHLLSPMMTWLCRDFVFRVTVAQNILYPSSSLMFPENAHSTYNWCI